MGVRRAKIFKHGGSQAVRLPAEFRFDAEEVFVSRDPLTGDVILSKKPTTWREFFSLRDAAEVSADFMKERGDAPPQIRKLLGE
ncbi:MAG: antitoxin [Burkholderiales bacterium]